MDLITKQTIINELKNRQFDNFVFETILPILEVNLEQISFVKNYYGLNNVLYIEEQGLDLLDFPMFLSINKDAGPNASNSISQNSVSSLKLIEQGLTDFFANSKATLYVEVTFIENILDNDAMWSVFHQLKNNRNKEPYEIMSRAYKYPDWYNAPYSESINLFENSFSTMKSFEKHRIEQNIFEINKLINIALSNGDFESLEHLRSQLIEQKNLLEN